MSMFLNQNDCCIWICITERGGGDLGNLTGGFCIDFFFLVTLSKIICCRKT